MSEMPEWFYIIATNARNNAWKNRDSKEVSEIGLGIVFCKALWDEFSKPENLLKIDVVKNVVENSIKVIDANAENFDACFLNDLYNSIEQFKE